MHTVAAQQFRVLRAMAVGRGADHAVLAAYRTRLGRSLRRLAIAVGPGGGEDSVTRRARVLTRVDRLLPSSPSPAAALVALTGIRGRRGTSRALPTAVWRRLRRGGAIDTRACVLALQGRRWSRPALEISVEHAAFEGGHCSVAAENHRQHTEESRQH